MAIEPHQDEPSFLHPMPSEQPPDFHALKKGVRARERRNVVGMALLLGLPFLGLVISFEAQARGGGNLAEVMGYIFTLLLIPGLERIASSLKHAKQCAVGVDAMRRVLSRHGLWALVVAAAIVGAACIAFLLATVRQP
jgi:hypothetical protein